MKRGNSKLFSNPTKGGGRRDGGNNNSNSNGNRNDNDNGMVKPGDVVAKIMLSNGTVLHIHSCICGTVIELNSSLKDNPSLLIHDPLLDGYIAVILPNGSFPPPPPATMTQSSTSTSIHGPSPGPTLSK